IVRAHSDMVWPVGEREVFEVTLASGRVRRTTAKHLWFSFDGWQRLEQLKVGDRVAIARRLPEIEPTAAMTDEEVVQLGQRSSEKRLPEKVFRLPKPQQALLLRRLWATHGCIHVRTPGKRGSHRVSFATASKGLAEDVAAMLLRF